MKKQAPKPETLYRVFHLGTDRLAYLPARGSLGLPLDEAQRLAAGLAAPTEVRPVWTPPEADVD